VTDCFIDTNILIYAISTDSSEAEKTKVARELLQTQRWAWSAQVAAEFVRATTSPRKPKPLRLDEARTWVEVWQRFPMLAVDGALVVEATRIAERYQTSYFDAQILAAARRMNLSTVFSEDMNHSQDYGGVIVRNPFLGI